MKRPRCRTCKHTMKGHKKQRCQKEVLQLLDDNTKYIGSVYNDKPSGHGILQMDGCVYEGFFLNGKKHGRGRLTFDSGISYKGDFQFDLYHGHGMLTLQNGSTYEGSFHTGTYHGHGHLTTNVSSYKGGWHHGTFHGHGVHKTNVGTYDGNFAYNLRDGHGKWIDRHLCSYDGEWKKGVRQGYGAAMDTRSIYQGFWDRDLQAGRGTWTHKMLGTYVGEWKRGKRHKKGVHTFTDGTIYTGSWSYGKRTGHGVLKWANGSFYKGEWLKDEYSGHGTLHYEGESSFVGTFRHNMREGIFSEIRTDGTESRGPWINDLRHGTFEDEGSTRLYIWNSLTSYKDLKAATISIHQMFRSKDHEGARVVLEHHPKLIRWKTFWKYDNGGQLVHLLKQEDIISILKQKSWDIYQNKRYELLENLVRQCSSQSLEKASEHAPELFDALSKEFTANPWMVRDQSYSKTTRKELLRGIFLGDFGRCEPKDPFTRLPLTKRSGKYLSKNKKKARDIYSRFMKSVNAKPTSREMARSFDLQDFEESLKNAREANDRETIKRLMRERNEYITQTKCY